MYGNTQLALVPILSTLCVCGNLDWAVSSTDYRSGTVNSKSFVGKVLLRIKWKFELTYAL